MPSNSETKEGKVEDLQIQLELLNRSMISKASQIVSDNEPTSDLWFQFRQALRDYKRRRTEILESQTSNPGPSGQYLGKNFQPS